MVILKNTIFIGVLIYAGIYDYKKRIIPDRVHIIIIVSALISDFSLRGSLLGFFLLPIPFLVPVFLDENSIGGGDIKLVGSTGFFLGLSNGIFSMIIGLSLFTILSLVLKRKGKELVPLAPYLAIGSIIALLIQ